MNKNPQWGLGVLSFLPLLGTIILGVWLGLEAGLNGFEFLDMLEDPEAMRPIIIKFAVGVLLITMLSLGVLAYFAYDLFIQNKKMDQNTKLLWLVLLGLLTLLVFPIYWFQHMHNREEE